MSSQALLKMNEFPCIHHLFYAVATHRRYASLHSTLIDTLFCGP